MFFVLVHDRAPYFVRGEQIALADESCLFIGRKPAGFECLQAVEKKYDHPDQNLPPQTDDFDNLLFPIKNFFPVVPS